MAAFIATAVRTANPTIFNYFYYAAVVCKQVFFGY
jgi:hypothetical protein